MSSLSRLLGAVSCSLLLLSAAPAAAATNATNLVAKALVTLDDLHNDKEFGNAHDLLKKAKGVMIVPELVKGGFIFGGEGGEAVLLAHDAGSGWSYPAFYTLASGSFGLQIGLQQSELVLIVLTERGMHAFMEDEFKIGAQAGLAIVTLGSSAQAATTSHVGADIVVWASSSGLYGGLTLEGTIIKPRYTYDEAYYGRPESANDILYKRSVTNPNADGLRQALDGLN